MLKVKYIIIALCFFLEMEIIGGMTEKQLQAAVKMVRNVCQPKTKATSVDIDKMHNGDWAIDHTAMCYMYCALNMYKLIDKENKFDSNSATNQLKQVPESYKESTKAMINDCKESAITLDDQCIAAYEIAKCFYFVNPEKYFLP